MLLQKDLEEIKKAYTLIRKGNCTRIDLGRGMVVYKVPSNNPNKYTIHVDIKIEEGKST